MTSGVPREHRPLFKKWGDNGYAPVTLEGAQIHAKGLGLAGENGLLVSNNDKNTVRLFGPPREALQIAFKNPMQHIVGTIFDKQYDGGFDLDNIVERMVHQRYADLPPPFKSNK